MVLIAAMLPPHLNKLFLYLMDEASRHEYACGSGDVIVPILITARGGGE
jgi:hypothetical protein